MIAILALLAALLPTPRCTHDRCTVTLSSTIASETFKPGTSAAPAYKLVLSDGRTYRDTQPVFTFSVMGPDSLRATAYATTTSGASRQKTITILVPAPPPVRMVDTVVMRVPGDTVWLYRAAVTTVNNQGEVNVYENGQHKGRLVFVNDGTVDAIAAPAPGAMAMHKLGNYPNQAKAIDALRRGTP